MLIEELGSIFESTDGRHAFRFWQNFKPQIILTDIKMSHMDGLDLISSVRRYDSRTRFVIISGYSEFSYAQKAIGYDVSDYLIKPVNRLKLRETLKTLITRLKQLDAYSRNTLQDCRKEVHFDNIAVNTVISYLNNNYRNDICLNMAANLVSMNSNYFSMLFKRVTGMNFIKYLQKLRIEKAKELLLQQDMKVQDILELVGFVNDKYFFKVFKEFVGATPHDYKQIHMVGEDIEENT